MTCTYCGESADTRDHIVPRGTSEGFSDAGNLVDACRECNSALGAKDFGPGTVGVRSKANWLAGWLSARYRKALSAPSWPESQINALGGSLKRRIKALQARKIRARLRIDTCSHVAENYVHEDEFSEFSGPGASASDKSFRINDGICS